MESPADDVSVTLVLMNTGPLLISD